MFKRLTIWGGGLIGGSIALAAKARGLAETTVAIDRAPSPALGNFAFDEWHASPEEARLKTLLGRSDLLVLATPVQAILDDLALALNHAPLVTDCGSTKHRVCKTAENTGFSARFVAGHPMAGHPDGGLRNARVDLFEGRKWILCPEVGSPEAHAQIEGLVSGLGAQVLRLSAEAHDHSVAYTSHLPQLLASALSAITSEEGASAAAGPGYASATRVAGGPENVWRDIFATNSAEIGSALRVLAEQLKKAGEELSQGDLEFALALLRRARDARDREDAGG